MSEIFSSAHFIVTVREAAASDANTDVRIRSERVRESQFRIEVNRRDGHAQRHVIAIKFRTVQVIKRVASNRCVAFEGSVIAELQELPFVGIDLRESRSAHE